MVLRCIAFRRGKLGEVLTSNVPEDLEVAVLMDVFDALTLGGYQFDRSQRVVTVVYRDPVRKSITSCVTCRLGSPIMTLGMCLKPCSISP